MKDLQDTLVGFLGFFIFAYAYEHFPLYAIGMIGFHVGVTTMRMNRSRSALSLHKPHPIENIEPGAS